MGRIILNAYLIINPMLFYVQQLEIYFLQNTRLRHVHELLANHFTEYTIRKNGRQFNILLCAFKLV